MINLAEMLMLISFYLVMPLERIRIHHALVGGISTIIYGKSTVVFWSGIMRSCPWYM